MDYNFQFDHGKSKLYQAICLTDEVEDELMRAVRVKYCEIEDKGYEVTMSRLFESLLAEGFNPLECMYLGYRIGVAETKMNCPLHALDPLMSIEKLR